MRPSLPRLAQAVLDADLPQWMRANKHKYHLDKRLTHITSPQLCDDTLRIFEKSLPEPYTCDLLDYNPGPCLWSRKLHDLVKPRRHILIEQHTDAFAAFLDPLLQEPNSSYRWAPNIAAAIDPQNRLLSDDVYEFEKDLSGTGKHQYAVNKKLLLTANLSLKARRVMGFIGSEAKQFLNNYYHALLARDQYLHRYGLVRLLAWVPDDSRMAVMPTCVNNRTKQSIQLESSCDVTSIAGPSQFRGLHPFQQRWPELDAENQQAVRKSQKQQGIDIDQSRVQPDPDPVLAALKPSIAEVRANEDRYPHHQVYIKRLLRLDDKLSLEMPDWYAKYHQERDKGFTRKKGPGGATPEMKLYRIMMTELRAHHNSYLKTKDFIWECRRLFLKFKDAWKRGWFSPTTGLPNKAHEAEVSELIKEDDSMQDARMKWKKDTRALMTKTLDDYRCYSSDPKVMAWNRRDYDPLLVKDSEFSPPSNPMTLFDFRPRPEFTSRIDSMDKQICFDYVCTTLMMSPSDSVIEAIKRIVPAGHDQFLERLPQLRNMERGGWYDLDHVNIRTLHHDYFVDIALAFYDWPHRPEIGSLMAVYTGVFSKGPV